MQNPYVQQALEIVKSRGITQSDEEVIASVKALAAGLEALDNPTPEAPAEPEQPTGLKLIDGFKPKGAIRDAGVVSGLDGKLYKILANGHFKKHGTTREAYLEACGYPKGTALVGKNLSAARREKMKGMELWKRRKGAPAAAVNADGF